MTAADLTQAELDWLVVDERRWARAREIAARHPGIDVTDLYHVICQLERRAEERLRRCLVPCRPSS